MISIKLKALIIKENLTMLDAIKKINLSKVKTVFVVDKKNKFLGTISDGDIRRALIRGQNLKIKLKIILKKNYVSFKKNSKHAKALEIMRKKDIKIAPILDKHKKIISYKYVNYLNIINIKKKIIIMAGGKGSRLMPFTKSTPKPMVLIDNKPILEHLILNAKSQGFKDVVISINHLGDKIRNYFKSGKNFGLNISYLTEKNPLGTCGSLSLLKSKIKESFIVCNGDIITNINFSELLKSHKKSKADVTIAIKSHEIQNPYGVVKIKNRKFVDIVEKPFTTSFINVGAYVFNPKILKYLKKNKKIDMTEFLLLLKKKRKNIYACPLYEQWFDIGRPKDLQKVRELKK